MNANSLFCQINQHHEIAEDQLVINLWEENRRELDLNEESDQKLCDILSHSYLELGKYKESLFFINKKIDFIRAQKSSGVNVDSFSLDFCSNMKIEIYNRQENIYLKYLTLREYVRLGGENVDLINYYKLTFETLFNKIIEPIFYCFCFLYSCVIIIHHSFSFNLVPKGIYISLVFLGFCFIILFGFFKSWIKRLLF